MGRLRQGNQRLWWHVLSPQRRLAQTGKFDGVGQDPHRLLVGVEPHGILRLDEIGVELRGPQVLLRHTDPRIGAVGLAGASDVPVSESRASMATFRVSYVRSWMV